MKTRRRYPSDQPPEPVRSILSLIQDRYFHFDVLGVRFNVPAPKLDWEVLRTHSNDALQFLHNPRYHPDWPSSLVLLQPRQKALRALVCTQFRVQPSYGEFALDLRASSQGDAQRLFFLIIGMLVLKGWQQEVVLYNQHTAYFGSRYLIAVSNDLEKGIQPRRQGVNLAVYVRRSKEGSPFAGRWCVHLEWRISGTPALRRFCRVVDMAGLVNFDHSGLWLRKATFQRGPSLDCWGAWSDMDDLQVNRKTLIERGRAFRDNYVDGQ